MQRRQDEVPGQRRLDGDRGGLGVPDLPDHDDVGVGTHHRAQAGGEAESRARVDLDLRDPLDLVLDRILDRDDVLLGDVELVERRVQRGALSGSGRPGRQDGAIGLLERPLVELALVVLHPQAVEIHDHGLLVEDAEHHRLAVHAGQRDDADVDVAALDREPDAPVLGQATLGDVEVAHDLDARHDARDHPSGDGRRGGEHPIHPEAHPHLGALRLEVDVRRTELDRLGDDRVHQLDDRRVLGGLAQVDDLGGIVLVLLLDGLLDRVVEAIELGDERRDVLARGDRGADLETGHDRHVVDREYVGRVGHHDQQRPFVDERHGHGVVAFRGRGRDQVGRPHVDVEDVQVQMIEPVALGDRPRQLVLRDDALGEQHHLGGLAGGPGRLDRCIHARGVGEAELHDHVGQEAA